MKHSLWFIIKCVLILSVICSSVYAHITDPSANEAKAIKVARESLKTNIAEPIDFDNMQFEADNNDGIWKVTNLQIDDVPKGAYYVYVQMLDSQVIGVGYAEQPNFN